MISLAITNYNRSDSVIESFIQVVDNPSISEIIIVDDHSEAAEYIKLWNLVNGLNNDKIKLYRNEANWRPFKNKYIAVSKCSNNWVILLDSDNIIDNNYVATVETMDKDEGVLYIPETLYREGKKSIGWCYEDFNDLIINRYNVKKHIDEPYFEALLNTGNHFFNRARYMQVVEKTREDHLLSVNDAIYFSYLWLLHKNRMKVVPGLYYVHQATKDSWWTVHSKDCIESARIITEKIKKWR